MPEEMCIRDSGRKAGDALEESVLASLRSVAAVWKEARSQVESLDERIREMCIRDSGSPGVTTGRRGSLLRARPQM